METVQVITKLYRCIVAEMTSATCTYDAKFGTNLILFNAAPFIIESEFRALLLEWFVKDTAHLGYIHLVHKCEQYLMAELFESALGQSIMIEALATSNYCLGCLLPLLYA